MRHISWLLRAVALGLGLYFGPYLGNYVQGTYFLILVLAIPTIAVN